MVLAEPANMKCDCVEFRTPVAAVQEQPHCWLQTYLLLQDSLQHAVILVGFVTSIGLPSSLNISTLYVS